MSLKRSPVQFKVTDMCRKLELQHKINITSHTRYVYWQSTDRDII